MFVLDDFIRGKQRPPLSKGGLGRDLLLEHSDVLMIG
ncbi:MAG: hypothetical protein G01um101418_928 [Parcubacteria group bacterium Gr01-1014_18]|nr:MAG: hypothetical protein G01um101418_928 [Parcubacteria group bacterium Gr01-1014_18]